MDLTPYLDALRRDLAAAAAPGGAEVSRAADLLTGSLDAAARLCLMEALSDAAAEITARLGGTTVDVRLRGREADLVVTDPAERPGPVAPRPGPEQGDVARITLRMAESLKQHVEAAATGEGISVNAWLVRAVAAAVHGGSRPGQPRGSGRRVTGYAQA